MPLWIVVTLFAAFCQNLRSALQKHLKGRLGTTGATFVRFGYGFPFALAYVGVLHWGFGMALPVPGADFALAAVLGGLAQIGATFLLVHLFSFRNFAVGTAYSKTEPVQAALFGVLILGEHVDLSAAIAIAVGVAGVILISMARVPMTAKAILASLTGKPALIGLASAALFGASAAFYRAASLALEGPGYLMQAAYALAVVTAFQSVVMIVWMALREPDQLKASCVHWRQAVWVGLVGVAGSAGWFTAMTLQQVAYVRALAQVELVFTLAFSWFVFRERVNGRELAGCVLIVAAILGLLWGRMG